MAKIKNPLDDFQLLTLSDESVYIANDDTVGVEQTTILINSAKPNIVNEETGEPYVVTGEELNAINRDDNSSYFDLYEKSDVYYYPECPGTEGGGTIISYEVGNVQYDSLLPATATGITVTWEYTATTQNPDGTTTTTTGTTSKVVPITPNTGDDDKTISGTIKIDGTDVEIPYEATQKNKHYQEITSYEVIKNISKPIYVPATATSVTLEWEYIMTYVDENGDTHTETGAESKTIEIEPNALNEDKTINGVITIGDTEIPYEIVQKGKNYKDVTNYEVSNITYPDNIGNDDTEFTVTWDYTITYIDENGETHTETGTDSVTIEVGPNETGEERDISGGIDMFGTIIEYEVVQTDDDIVPDDNYLITKYYSDGDNPTIIYNFYMSTVENIIYNGTDIKSQTTGTSVTCRGCYTFNEGGEILLKIKIHENEDKSIYADLTETDIVKCAVKEGIKSLRGSFGSCKKLKLVVLPDSIESIESAFWGCNNLETVDLSRVVTPPTIDENAFDSVESDDFKIIVPEESINEYKTAQYWSKYADKIIAG